MNKMLVLGGIGAALAVGLSGCSSSQPPASSSTAGAAKVTEAQTSAVPSTGSTALTALCSLDIINGVAAKTAPVLTIGKPASFGGWFATSAKQPVPTFDVTLIGGTGFVFTGHDVVLRNDVTHAIHGIAGAKYGFNANTTFAGAVPGTYRVELVSPHGDSCNTGISVSMVN